MDIFTEAPQANAFVPLLEHQSATPASFYSGPPVLHYYSQKCKVIVLESDLSRSAAVERLAQGSEKLSAVNGDSSNGREPAADDSQEGESASTRRVINDIDVWVTSEKLLLYSPPAQTGISIPYPTIALHAIQSLPDPPASDQQGLYMQLLSKVPEAEAGGEEDNDEDEAEDSISMTVIPQNDAPPPPPPAATELDSQDTDHSPQPPAVAMFTALSNCSNLHPDPADEHQVSTGIQGSALFQSGLIAPGNSSGEELPPPMPGSGGWITAENMSEYVDEDGNWIGQEENLGAGAGSVRRREEDEDGDDGDDAHATSENGTGEESKWRRTG